MARPGDLPARTMRATSHVVREAILHSALDAFSARGFDSVSTRAIAAAAGIEQGQLTYYFPSKEGLWRETVARYNRDFEIILERAPSTTASPAKALKQGRPVLEQILRFLHHNRQLAAMIGQEFSRQSSRHDWLARTIAVPTWKRLEPLFKVVAASRAPVAAPIMHYFQFLGGALMFFGASDNLREFLGAVDDDAAAESFIALHLQSYFDA